MVAQIAVNEQGKAPFIPTNYAIRQNGQPMPCRFIRFEDDFAVVQAPNGREYSFSRDALVSTAEVESQLRRDRVAFVASSYRFEEVTAGVIRCSHPTKKTSSYIIMETPAGWVCSCPANAKNLFGGCKHTQAMPVEVPAAKTPASVCQPVAAEDW